MLTDVEVGDRLLDVGVLHFEQLESLADGIFDKRVGLSINRKNAPSATRGERQRERVVHSHAEPQKDVRRLLDARFGVERVAELVLHAQRLGVGLRRTLVQHTQRRQRCDDVGHLRLLARTVVFVALLQRREVAALTRVNLQRLHLSLCPPLTAGSSLVGPARSAVSRLLAQTQQDRPVECVRAVCVLCCVHVCLTTKGAAGCSL